MSDELTDETDRGVVHESRLTWFGDFNAFECPQCCVTGCKFIAERDDGAWCCWKHGRFEVEYGRSEPETTEQTTLITDGGQSTDVTYRDPSYCCMNCGCETFRERQHPYDECVSCGARRDVKRGSNSERCEVRTATEQYGGRQ